jgi:putative addiction module killer protein
MVSYVLPPCMPEARQYETQDGNCPFRRWFFRLEARAAARVTRVVAKLEGGLRPDVKGVGEGVMEARIDYGPGYRVYFGLDGVTLVILLGGGDKRTQQQDIQAAHVAWADYKARKKEGAKDHGANP